MSSGSKGGGPVWHDAWKRTHPGHDDLRELHEGLRRELHERHQRVLSLADTVTDRWEKAAFLGFGEGASVYDSCMVIGDVSVGANTWVGPQTVLDGSGGLEIGAWCSIATGVQIYSHDTVRWALSGGRIPADRQPTRIGDCCYLGPQSVIGRGTTIGSHCVVGALSLVTSDVPDYSVVAGTPARVIGRVEIDDAGEIRMIYDDPRPGSAE